MHTSICLPWLHPCLLASLPVSSPVSSPTALHLAEDVATSIQSYSSDMLTCCRNSTKGLPRDCLPLCMPVCLIACLPACLSRCQPCRLPALSPDRCTLVKLGSQRLNLAPAFLQFGMSDTSWRRCQNSCLTLRCNHTPSPRPRRRPSRPPQRRSYVTRRSTYCIRRMGLPPPPRRPTRNRPSGTHRPPRKIRLWS